MDKTALTIIISGFCACYCIFLIIVALVGIFSRLDPLLYGIAYDQHGLFIDKDNLYVGGRHALGLGLEFIKFPRQTFPIKTEMFRTQRLLAFSDRISGELRSKESKKGIDLSPDPWGPSTKGFGTIKARTREGLIINMDILISYKLTTSNEDKEKANQLYNIYKMFEYNWDEMLARLTQAEVKDSASKYQAFDFFQKRAEIGRYIFDHLKETCTQYHITLQSLNVLNLQFPVEFESAVEQTEIVVQKTQTKEYLRQAMEIQAETRILVASIQKDMDIDKEEAEGKADLLASNAIAEATVLRLDKQRLALVNVKSTLQLDDKLDDSAANKLLAFMWVYVCFFLLFQLKQSLKYNDVDLIRLATGLPKDLKNA